MSISRHHADWLCLVEVSGPFVSMPVLQRVFPQGLEPRDPVQAKTLRTAYEEWQDNPNAPGRQRAWVIHILTAVLGYPECQITEGQSLPTGMEMPMPEMGETLRPDFVLVDPSRSNTSDQAQLLITSYSVAQLLDKPVIGKHWKATPATRMVELLHGAGVPLGLVTNGEQWMLVYAPRGETTGYASWYATIWLDEPITLRAFHSLLGARRLFGVALDCTLPAMLKESAQDQQEVTDQLGYQVREAVEVLVQSLDALDKESGHRLLKGVSESALYEAALTVMMRLVFLFSAEERGLLHLGKPLYDDNYAVSTLQEQLQEVADRYGEEVLERRLDAWARLLATFRAVHGGIHHQDLLMQAYGGSLFDLDRYPFLEGRGAGTSWSSTAAEPMAVNNRVVLHLLNSLQRLRTKIGAGGIAETRRISFRALGVEQIGHVYEGLLDHTAVRASEPVLGLKGTRSKEPEILLSILEAHIGRGQEKLIEFLKNETGRSVSALRRALDEGRLLDEHKLLIACSQDHGLLARIRTFAGLIRNDSFDRPLVVLPGSVYVTAGTTRRSSGTHYTPPSLTEPIVKHTLEPLVYEGPSEGYPKAEWKLKSPKAILDLKVCDMAVGSGAFLVQACRFLAERLMEAWENEEKKHPGQVLITPDGKFSVGSPSERLVPADTNERIAIARRVVADRCLYGVDINPMAVEMAKLSLWLITVDANRPFSFLDHAFKSGDSLLGITSLEQLENFSLRPGCSKQLGFATLNLWQHIDDARKKREVLGAMQSDTPEQIAAKAVLHAEAEEAVAKLHAAADVLVAVELKGLKGHAYESERETSAAHIMLHWAKGLSELQVYAGQCLGGRNCLHWALVFPEIIGRGGFDAFISNPPYMGGQKITGAFGEEYRNYLIATLANGQRGSADLAAYFLLQGIHLLRPKRCLGLITTSSIAEGNTRDVGILNILNRGATILRASVKEDWPGAANVTYCPICIFTGDYAGTIFLNGEIVSRITASLEANEGEFKVAPHALVVNNEITFQGSIVLGMGFIINSLEAEELVEQDPKYRDVIFPYLTGKDINSRWDFSSDSFAINFFDWPFDRTTKDGSSAARTASDYPLALKIIEERVKPERTRIDERGEFVLRRPLPQKWWIYGEKRPALYSRLRSLKWAMCVATAATKYLSFAVIRKPVVFSHSLSVVASDSCGVFACLNSTFHDVWARKYSSSNLLLIRYTPTTSLLTFPFPTESVNLSEIGEIYLNLRTEVMARRKEGFVDVYNRFHNHAETATDIAELRRLHIEMDHAVAAAYGWQDLDLGHGFHETKQGVRYTLSEPARREALDRLLALNHQRHAEEEAERVSKGVVAPAKRGHKRNSASKTTTPRLFD